MNRVAGLIVVGILSLAGLMIFVYNKINEEKNLDRPASDYAIIGKWELPLELEEVSGIEWLGDSKIACVQDEDGVIYVFNLKTSKVEQRINFAGHGDYEDIRVVGKTAYILRSDGNIFEVSNFLFERFHTRIHNNFLTKKQNLESLAWDKVNNRLLLAVKDRELNDDTFKGIYQFSLSDKQLATKPAYRLDMEDTLLKNIDSKLIKRLQPSALGIHPSNGNFYILDGRAPQLIIADNKLKLEKAYTLQEGDFEQAEGITFSEDGRLFISNEGNGDKANILEVEFK